MKMLEFSYDKRRKKEKSHIRKPEKKAIEERTMQEVAALPGYKKSDASHLFVFSEVESPLVKVRSRR